MTDAPAFQLLHREHTRSIRARWLMEEMGLSYDLVAVGGEAASVSHPLGKIPALSDGGEDVFESVAIMQYLLGKYGPSPLEVRPDEIDYGRYLSWLHFGEAGMIMPVSLLLAHTVLFPEDKRDPKLAAWARSESDEILTCLGEKALGDREYIAAGRFTAADISVIYMLYLLKLMRAFSNAPENVKAYFKRMTSRPSWTAASAAD